MSSELSEGLIRDAMGLPQDQRAALAAMLIDSLDDTVDEDAEAAWALEIQRRIEDVESGKVTPIPWPEARKLILSDERPDV